jgi:putative aminopeptidase FrvX
MEVRLDEVVSDADEVKALGIEVGDFVSLDPRVQITPSGYVKSRHLDDKACVACLLAMIEAIKAEGKELPYTTHFFISNYEEVGHGSSASIPTGVVEFMAVDMAAPGEGQTSHEHKVTICAKDSSGPYDYALKGQLVQLAKQGALDYVIDIYPFYGSDASAALRAGWAFKHSLIGPGVDASHSFERTHTEGLVATTQLGLAYLMSPMVD